MAEDGAMRRWSMPWDSSGQTEQHGQWTGRLYPKENKLTVPGGIASQERSRSTTPGLTPISKFFVIHTRSNSSHDCLCVCFGLWCFRVIVAFFFGKSGGIVRCNITIIMQAYTTSSATSTKSACARYIQTSCLLFVHVGKACFLTCSLIYLFLLSRCHIDRL